MSLENTSGDLALESLLQIAADFLAGDIGTSLTMRLFKDGFNPTPASVYADFVAQEADFTGYASVALTLEGPVLAFGGTADLVSSVAALFQLTALTTTNDVAGWWLEWNDGGGPAVHKVLAYGVFSSALHFNQIGNYALLNTVLAFPGPIVQVEADY